MKAKLTTRQTFHTCYWAKFEHKLLKSLNLLPALCLSIHFQLTLIHIWVTLAQQMLVAMVTGFKCSRRHAPLMDCSYTSDTQEGGGDRW